jgi:hypothetical protein
MSFARETWSAAREESAASAAGDIGTIVARALMGRKFLDISSGVTLYVVGMEWPALSVEGHLLLENLQTRERARKRCVYDVLTHHIRMYPA